MTIRAILFDKDGTLLDFEATFAPATSKVLTALATNNSVPVSELADAVGFDLDTDSVSHDSILIAGSLDNIANNLFAFEKALSYDAFLQEVDRLYVQHSLTSLVGFDYLVPTLDALRSMKLPLGIATNDSENGAQSHLDQLSITDYFSFIAGSDSGYGEKPDPGMVLAFSEELKLARDEVMMVGDSTHDLIAARKADAVSIGVLSGLASRDELAPYADHVLNDISELPELVKNLNHKGDRHG